jgi:hypothetical protein
LVAGRGRRAALPDDGYEPPARLLVDHGRCVVRFITEDGRTTKDFDFTIFLVSRALQVAFARAFDRATGPSGTHKTMNTANEYFRMLRLFSGHLATLPRPPQRPEQLAPSHLVGHTLRRKHLRRFRREVGTLRTCLLAVDGLSGPFVAKLVELSATRDPPTMLSSYSRAEFNRILAAARKDARAAATRIRAHRELLERWRGGGIDETSDRTTWELGAILNHIERHGDVPRHEYGARLPLRWVAAHGTVRDLVSLLHLHCHEAAAFLVLLIGLTGQNGGTLADAPAAHHRADGAAGGTATAIVELRKPRRGRWRSHMDVALAGLPDWLGPMPSGPVTAKEELHTPFGVYMLVAELTELARRFTGSDRLLVSWANRGYMVGRGFRIGLLSEMVPRWGRSQALPADPPPDAPPDDGDASAPPSRTVDPQPLEVTMPRLRVSFVQHHQKAVAHTDQVLATEYLGRDRGNIADYQQLVGRVLEEQVDKAKASVVLATLTDADLTEARQHPSTVAARFGIDVLTLKRMLGGELDTVLAACVDHTNSPYTPAGEPCRASFLRCLDCPNARATPQHLPIQALALDALTVRRAELPPLEWARRFALPHAQLSDLLDRFPPATVEAARAEATEADRRLVARFLARELDHT